MKNKIKDPKAHLKKNHQSQALREAKKLLWNPLSIKKITKPKVKIHLSKDKHRAISKTHVNNQFSHLLR